jgi:ribonuclease HI
VPASTLARYPGWKPGQCFTCRDRAKGKSRPAGAPVEENLTVAEVLARYRGGPTTGLFTDGSANPNPGPGGWGVVYVVDDEVIDQLHGHEPHTTNNRMELVALIRAFEIATPSVPLDVFSDSELCVKTINEWAPVWESRGWRRKGGEIKNLELVVELYTLARARPNLTLRWIKAHDGSRWNEYADSLATAYRREQL